MILARGGEWTYSADPASSDRDWVRFKLGDTDPAVPLLSDQEIDAALAEQSSVHRAAADCADAIAGQYRKKHASAITDGAGNTRSTQPQQVVEHYEALARLLRQQATTAASGGIGRPYIGGVSQANKDAIAADSDIVRPELTRGMHDAQ